MAETEKITINMNVVELGKIDLLVEEGFYSNRTDFIRASIRRHLDKYDSNVDTFVRKRALTLGLLGYGAKTLKKRVANNEKISAFVVGMLVIEDDVTPELADAAFDSVQVFGVIKANKAVKQILQAKNPLDT